MPYLPQKTISVDEAIKSLLNREGDVIGSSYMKYRSVAKDVYLDLNLQAIRYTKRQLITVNKKTNSINLPEDYILFSSISYIDECGQIVPMVINNNLTDDIIDIDQDKDCKCGCGCKSDLCGAIKNYELIEEKVIEKMPLGNEVCFIRTTVKRTDEDGSFYQEITQPTRIYEDGVWVNTELVTTREAMCQLEVSECGCVKETEKNRCAVTSCCSAATIQEECGCLCPPADCNTYNFSEEGDRLVFPSNFCHDKVLIRYYPDFSVKELKIPLVAKEAFLSGVKYYTLSYNKKALMWQVQRSEMDYKSKRKFLSKILNKLSIAAIKSVLTPKRMMP